MPLKRGQTKAFPSAKKHFKLASHWQNDFVVMQSKANDKLYPGKREFFDKPVSYATGQSANKATTLKPMEVYHKITPVRSIQQSINLIRALKTEQKEEISKARPKSVAYNVASFSDSYGFIPNLRESVERQDSFLPIKKQLRKFEGDGFLSSSSPNSKRGAATSSAYYQSNPIGDGQMQAVTQSQWASGAYEQNMSDVNVQNPVMAQTTGEFEVPTRKRRMKRRRGKGKRPQTGGENGVYSGVVNAEHVMQLNSQS